MALDSSSNVLTSSMAFSYKLMELRVCTTLQMGKIYQQNEHIIVIIAIRQHSKFVYKQNKKRKN